jgi:phosphoglycerol transferase
LKRLFQNNPALLENIFYYSMALILSVLIMIFTLQLWETDLRYPLPWDGDGKNVPVIIKGLIDNGWFTHNNYIGAPFGSVAYDFPTADGLYLIIFWFISLFIKKWVIITNAFILSTFPLTTLSTLFVMRHFKISYPVAILGGLLYTFTPYHLFRLFGHSFLASYFLIPLSTMVVLWTMQDSPMIHLYIKGNGRFGVSVEKQRFYPGLIICLLVSGSGIYYAVFSLFFMVCAGLILIIKQRKIVFLLAPIIFSSVILFGILINTLPSVLYQILYGPGLEPRVRLPLESELYGLRISQLLFPIIGHRIDFFNRFSTSSPTFPPATENVFSALGIIVSFGFIILLIFLLSEGNLKIKSFQTIKDLSYLNILAILLATIGGFGAVISFVISPQIRAYNRISIFIAFYSVFALMLLIDYLIKRMKMDQGAFRAVSALLLFCLLIIGVLDGTSPRQTPDYTGQNNRYLASRVFVQKVEKSLPKGSMVFQLPYIPYPENPPVLAMVDYDQFFGYLNSKDLRWSYGANRGREGDLWIRKVSQEKVPDLLNNLINEGYAGITIDRNGYEDSAAAITSELTTILKQQPIESRDHRYLFYSLVNYKPDEN